MVEKRLHICHLTVLNPARHSRIFYKEAVSQAKAGHRVTVIGQDSASRPYVESGVKIIPTGPFGRLSWGRLMARRRILDLACGTCADVYQIHSPELLKVGEALKVHRPSVKLIYDQHEDYGANIRAGAGYPLWLREWLARWICKQEAQFTKYGDGVIYAEDCYAQRPEIPGCVVRNKFQRPVELPKVEPALVPRLLYTGTVADAWGIGRTLELWRSLNQLTAVDLVVAGHSQAAHWAEDLQKQVASMGLSERFRLVGAGKYVPYEQVIAEVAACTAGTAFYQAAPHLREKVPTKFYEFMGMGKPLLFSQNPAWEALNQRSPFGRTVKFPLDSHSLVQIVGWLQSPYYIPQLPPEEWSWTSEEKRMLDFIGSIAGGEGEPSIACFND